MQQQSIQLILVDPNHRVTTAFIERFDYLPNIQVVMWAMLLAVEQHNRHADRNIVSIACPGFGTGIGRIPPDEAARQMALAYDHFIYPPKFLNCFVAASRQLQIWEDYT